MIRKLVKQMLAAQVLSALTVSVCLLIDSIMIGQFLGVTSIAAYGLANPLLLIIGAVGSMLSAGAQVVCSRSLGRGSQEETNIGFSSAPAVGACFSAVFVIAVALLLSPLARALGAGKDAKLLSDTKDYISGFVIGVPATMASLILVPFLQMAGKSGLLVAAVLSMTVTDVAFDLLSVLVFGGGMFGMGLASSLSYYAAMLVGGGYLLSKKCVFRFSMRRVRLQKIRDMLLGGVPTVFNMAASVVLVYLMNKILLSAGGSAAVAAFAVITSIGNASNCVSTGLGGVSLTMCGILFGEEDRTGLKELVRLLARYGLMLGMGAMVLLLAIAPWAVKLFIPEAGDSRTFAVWGLRLYSLGLIPCCLNSALKNGYQGVEKVRMTEMISVVQNAILPVLAGCLLSLAGMKTVWLYNFAGEAGALALILLYLQRKGCLSFREAESVLLLPLSFGVPPEDRMEADIKNLDDVVKASRGAHGFCIAHGCGGRLANHLSLCVEEMGSNVIEHGFAPKGQNHLSIRLQYRNGKYTIRFRDDCGAFDPVHYVTGEEGMHKVGIRLAMHVAEEARYTYSMNLNNLTLVLSEHEAGSEAPDAFAGQEG